MVAIVNQTRNVTRSLAHLLLLSCNRGIFRMPCFLPRVRSRARARSPRQKKKDNLSLQKPRQPSQRMPIYNFSLKEITRIKYSEAYVYRRSRIPQVTYTAGYVYRRSRIPQVTYTAGYVYMPKGVLPPTSFFFRNRSTCSFFRTKGRENPAI